MKNPTPQFMWLTENWDLRFTIQMRNSNWSFGEKKEVIVPKHRTEDKDMLEILDMVHLYMMEWVPDYGQEVKKAEETNTRDTNWMEELNDPVWIIDMDLRFNRAKAFCYAFLILWAWFLWYSALGIDGSFAYAPEDIAQLESQIEELRMIRDQEHSSCVAVCDGARLWYDSQVIKLQGEIKVQKNQ